MRRALGFTLLEMVVAIGIFAVIAAVSYGTLNRFIAQRSDIAVRQEQLKGLQLAFALLEQDLRFAADRAVRDGFGDPEGALISTPDSQPAPGELLRITASAPALTAGDAGLQRLQRVAWRLNDGQLARVAWRVLDRDQDSVEYIRPLLDGVAAASLQFFVFDVAQGLTSVTEWTQAERLPDAVEVLVTLANGREFRRLLQLANGF